MKVIKPEPKHIHYWTALVESFYKEGVDNYGFGYKRQDAERSYFLWLGRQPGYVLQHEGEIIGCIGGVIAPHYLDYSTLYFHECIWYVKPEYRNKGGGIKLLARVEKECRKRGVSKMVMTHTYSMMPEYFESLYTKLGYTKLETKYIKDVNYGTRERISKETS